MSYCQTSRLIEYKELSASNIDEIFKIKNGDEFSKKISDLYFNIYLYDSLSKEKQGLSNEQCDIIKDKINPDSLKKLDKLYLLKLTNEYCPNLKNSDQINLSKQTLQQNLNSSNLLDIYTGFFGIISNNKNLDEETQQQLMQSCQKLNKFIEQDGRTKLTKGSDAPSIYYSGYVLEIVSECLSQFSEQEDFVNQITKQFKIFMGSLLLNGNQIAQDQFAIAVTNEPYFGLNAQIFNSVEKILGSDLYMNTLAPVIQEYQKLYKQGLIRFLLSNEQILTNNKDKYLLLKAYQDHQNLPYISVQQSKYLIKNGKVEVLFRWETLSGQVVQNDELLNQNITIQLLDRSDLVLQSNVKLQKNSNNSDWSLKALFDQSHIKYFGNYKLKISNQSSSQNSWTLQQQILIAANVTIQYLKFDVNESLTQVPVEFSNKLKQNEQILMPIQLQGDKDIIHFQLKLDFGENVKFQPRQIGLLLQHPSNQYATTIAQANYNSYSNIYQGTIQLSNKSVIQPYSNTYLGALIISDQRLEENIWWNFAKFKISYKSPKLDGANQDLEYTQLPVINHTFQPPQKQISILFTYVTCGALGLVFIGFLVLLQKIGVNLSGFPTKSFYGIANIIFILFIVTLLYLLFHFWVFIDLVQLFYTLLILSIPFFIISRYSLPYIKSLRY